MTSKNAHLSLFGLVLAAWSSIGCQMADVMYVHDDFKTIEEIGPIAVLPIIDARVAPDADHDFAEVTAGQQVAVVGNLQKKGYEVAATADIGAVSSLSGEDFEKADAEWVRALGPPEVRWVMGVLVTDLTSTVALGKYANATVTAYLFNRDTGELWWKAAATAKSSAGILTSLMINEEKGAVQGAIVHVGMAYPTNRDRLKVGPRRTGRATSATP
ncbi:MAG: hypothetical protein ACI82F_001782 [Planctomycetota bacterium]|jgi:hypothetical protein